MKAGRDQLSPRELELVRVLTDQLCRAMGLPVGDEDLRPGLGQRQKLVIARALLCRAEYLIFDEATSSVDMESEREIWNCIEELAQTRTLVLISHRLSTIRSADVIYVLENGAIAQQGSHGELMAEPGLYRRLVEEQAQLERKGEEGLAHA